MNKFDYALAQKRIILACSVLKLISLSFKLIDQVLPFLSVAFNYKNSKFKLIKHEMEMPLQT